MSEITPIAGYASYPITNVPENGQDADFNLVKAILQDTYNRIAYLKGIQDTAGTDIVALQNADVGILANLVTITNNLNSAVTLIENINTNEGGNVKNTTPDDYDTPTYLVNGESRKLGMEHLDHQLKSVTDMLSIITPLLTTAQNNITSLVGKISATALDGNSGLGITGATYLVSTDKTDGALIKLDKPILTGRRTGHYNFIQSVKNWRDISFGESGGATPTQYFYDDLYTSTYIYSGSPTTPNAYDTVDQSFGRTDISWIMASIVVTIPAGMTQIKMNFSGTGTISPTVTFAGDPNNNQVAITSLDTWTAVPIGSQGTSLVVKFVGTSASKLYNYMVLFKA